MNDWEARLIDQVRELERAASADKFRFYYGDRESAMKAAALESPKAKM